MASKIYTVNWDTISSDEAIYTLKNKTTLSFSEDKLDNLTVSIVDGVLVVENKNNNKKIRFSKYSQLKYFKTLEDDGAVHTTNIISESVVYNTSSVYSTPKKGKITGSNYRDIIDARGYTICDKNGDEIEDVNKKLKGLTLSSGNGIDKIYGSKYKDTINSGNQNDIIYSSLGNDTITGGSGTNRIIYSGNFDTDTINLTKKENLELDLSSYGSVDNYKFEVSGKNLVITVSDENTTYGKIILKNFGKSNVVSTGSVKLYYTDTDYIDLNSFDLIYNDHSKFSTKGVFNGSRFSETIDASGVTTAYGKNNKGATINGGAGYNTIIGTDGFNDTLKGGNNGNDITAGNGNKTITTGNGNDSISVTGDGIHNIKTGNGENTVTLTGNGKNTVTGGNGKDIVTLDGNATSSINAGNGENELTVKGSGDNTLKTGSGADTFDIFGNTTTKIYAGAGENTINIHNTEGTFGDVTIYEQSVKANNIINFTDELNTNYIFSRSGDNLVIKNEVTSSQITLQKYFANNKKYAKYSFKIKDNIYALEDMLAITKGMVLNGKGTIKGTDFNDVIIADDYDENVAASKDYITPGKGTDEILAGKGSNLIYLYEGDGNDTILNGGGTDTIVFQSGVKFNFKIVDNDLIINYGSSDDSVTIKDYVSGDCSVKYIQSGRTTKAVKDYFTTLYRGDSTVTVTTTPTTTSTIILKGGFDDETHVYELKSSSGTREAKIQYLSNGRLVIEGDFIQVTTATGQKDDLIVLGNYNNIDTGDEDDIVRLGAVVDANRKYYNNQSNYNVIKTGDGDDYIYSFGVNNNFDTGYGEDKIAFPQGINLLAETYKNCEQTRIVGTNTEEYDGIIGWYEQGNEGGDCRLFSLLDSLSKTNSGLSIDDCVTITGNKTDGYSVCFKNYSGENNTAHITQNDLNDYKYVYGDLDVVLIDKALNILIGENKDEDMTCVEDANYNTISDYFFGTKDTTGVSYSDLDYSTFVERFNTMWDAYKNGEISNITVGTPDIMQTDSLYQLGIICGHAYSVKDLTIINKDDSTVNLDKSYITLVNPWDNADCLNLTLTKFYSLYPCAIAYGVDLFDENKTISQGDTLPISTYNSSELDTIANETACWQNSSISAEINYNDNNLTNDSMCVSVVDVFSKDDILMV